MPGLVPRAFIDDLLNRIDIVEIIDSRVPLKKKGQGYWACCPFHNENTPSFSVSQNKQFYHCFGCLQSGNAISFLMDYDHMEFVEAIETLAQTIGIEVPREQGQTQGSRSSDAEPLYECLQRCSAYYKAELKRGPEAITYLQNRGIDGQTAKDYCIGYAPSGWNNLVGDQKSLVAAGMLIEKDTGQTYDRFRHRLMFPIRDRLGRTLAFGGRAIAATDNPKYLNSPETTIFHKSAETYGLFELKKATNHIQKIYITEGYMDVIALAQYGVKTAVATLGTAINSAQIEKLFRVCKNLVFCFDGDSAGKKAAWRSLEQCLSSLKEGRLARFLFLPENHDPDSYIREYGKDDFEQQSHRATTLIEYLLQTLLAECDTRSPEGKSQFLDRLRPYFHQIPLQSLKDQILGEVERRLSIPLNTRLLSLLGEGQNRSRAQISMPDNRWTPARLAINLLLLKPSLADSTGSQHHLFGSKIPDVELLLQILDILHEQPGISTQNLLERFERSDDKTYLYQLAAMQPVIEDEGNIARMLEDCLQRLQSQYIKHRQKQLIDKLKSAIPLSEAEQLEHKQLFTKRQ